MNCRQELNRERENDEKEEQCTSRLIDEYKSLVSENVSPRTLVPSLILKYFTLSYQMSFTSLGLVPHQSIFNEISNY